MIKKHSDKRNFGSKRSRVSSNSVSRGAADARAGTCLTHGMSSEEIERLSGAFHWCRRSGLKFFYGVLGDEIVEVSPNEARALLREFKKRLTQRQRRKGFAQVWVEVLEVEGGIHFNMVFVGDRDMANWVAESFPQYFASGFGKRRAVQEVTDWQGLFTYLVKERTPQADFNKKKFRGSRRKGSHHNPLGGDRVRLSQKLHASCVEAGLVRNHKKSYRKLRRDG